MNIHSSRRENEAAPHCPIACSRFQRGTGTRSLQFSIPPFLCHPLMIYLQRSSLWCCDEGESRAGSPKFENVAAVIEVGLPRWGPPKLSLSLHSFNLQYTSAPWRENICTIERSQQASEHNPATKAFFYRVVHAWREGGRLQKDEKHEGSHSS